MELQEKLPEEEKFVTAKERIALSNNEPINKEVLLHTTATDDMDPDTVCGIWHFKPQWLQKYATSRSFIILFSIIGMLQGTAFSYFTGIMTTLEKRYAFSSKVSGAIMMIDEISPLIFGPIVGHFGGRMHRPRTMAAGLICSLLFPLISSLPYFVYGPQQQTITSFQAQNETNGQQYCDVNNEIQDSCAEDGASTTTIAVACLILGSFLKGFGAIGIYVIGMSYMDDNTNKENLPLYFALTQAFKLFGPIIGYSMASAFLKYYEDPFGDPGFGPEDPRWIGAWWIGFVIQVVLLFAFVFPIMLFPKRLPSDKRRSLSNTEEFDRQNVSEKLLGMLSAFKRMAKNSVYVLFVLGVVLYSNGQAGHSMLLPKYMENQFHLPASEASLFSGPPGLIAMQIMIIIGGFVVWKWQPSAKKILIAQALVQFIWTFTLLFLMYPSCQHFEMRGTLLTENGLQIENECNSACSCTTNSYSPVCGPDGESTYFSPCYAGCSSIESSDDSIITDCSCLFDTNGTILDHSANVTKGPCQTSECWNQTLIYLILYPIFTSVSIFLLVAEILILLRCVEPQDKCLSLGMFEACLSLFALVPNPPMYGALADSACLVWESTCDKTGNCWLYDVDKLNYLLHGVSAMFIFLSCICFIALYFMSHKFGNLYTDTDDRNYKNEVKT